jgi:hypothetical protein
MTIPDEFQGSSGESETHLGASGHPHGVLPSTDGVPLERTPHLREATERLSAALFNVVHQTTAKGRDRSLAALVALIYGPTPFGGVNSLRDVAMRYGMTEQNLFRLMRGHRELLDRAADPEYEI